MFEAVHNLAAIRVQLNVPDGADCLDVNDEIIGIRKPGPTCYVVDLDRHGSIEIDCRGLNEI